MPSGSANSKLSPERSLATPSPSSRAAQKSSASGDATRETMRCTIPGPGRPGIAPGYSKNVRSAPALPSSSA